MRPGGLYRLSGGCSLVSEWCERFWDGLQWPKRGYTGSQEAAQCMISVSVWCKSFWDGLQWPSRGYTDSQEAAQRSLSDARGSGMISSDPWGLRGYTGSQEAAQWSLSDARGSGMVSSDPGGAIQALRRLLDGLWVMLEVLGWSPVTHEGLYILLYVL